MNKQKWLIAGLSVAMLASLSLGLTACSIGKKPDTPTTEHTHTYDAWDHDETQHWKYCDEHGTDKSNIDESTKANHTFTNGTCVCGATQGSETPTAELDTREFYVVGGGMGDLATGTWTGPNASFKFTKAAEPDENGYTVYTYQMKLYSADEFKFIEKNTISTTEKDDEGNFLWDAATTFMLADLDVTAVPGAFTGDDNIVVNIGADGIYKFTLLTKKGGAAKENKMKVELVETIEPLDIEAQYEMYLVGAIYSKPGCNWPGNFSSLSEVTTKCYKMELQEDGRTFSIEVKLRPADNFKVWNYKLGNKDAGYYPTGLGGDLKVSEDGWYVISWKVGEAMPKITPHEHRYTVWGYNAEGHWKQCPLDDAIGEETRAEHTFDPETHTCECGAPEPVTCAHDGKINYEYTVIPEVKAEGDTLKGKCEKCGKEVDVNYKKGFTGDATVVNTSGTIGDISEAGTYYFTTGNQWQTLGMIIKETGTYTFSFEEVCDLNETDANLLLVGLSFGTQYATTFSRNADSLVYAMSSDSVAGVLTSKSATKQQINTYNVKLNGNTLDTRNVKHEAFTTLSFTVKEEQLSSGELYVTLHLEGYITKDNGYYEIAAENSLSHLVTVTKSAAETISAPAEVALLPEKKD